MPTIGVVSVEGSGMKTDLQMKCMEMEQYRVRKPRGHEYFVRPIYQYTSIENRTVADLREDDWKKERTYGWW